MLAEVGHTQSLLRRQPSVVGFVRMTVDPLLIMLTFIAFTIAWGEEFDAPDLVLALILFSLTFPGSVPMAGSSRALLGEIVTGWAATVLILLFLGYVTDSLRMFNPAMLAAWVAAVPAVLYFARRLVPTVIRRILALEGRRAAVIVGVTGPGRKLAGEFAASGYLGVDVMGFFDDRAPARLGVLPECGLRGRLEDLPAFVKANGVEAIFVALPMASQPRIVKLLDELRDTTTSVYFVPDVFLTDLIQARIDDINGIPVVAVCETPYYGVNGMVKRIEDLLLSALILALVAPLMVAIAVGVKLSSPGPVIFRQRRYGLDGKEIVVFKFRTMRVMEDGPDVPQATRDDPRVTKLGAILRATSLDELPQFLNVLQGRMSIVGPRPHAVAHNEAYRKLIKGYMVRHKVKPGVTGLAQVNGFRGEIQSLDKMQKRIDYDLEYLRNWSVGLDLRIILRTAVIVLKGDRHAY
jgi:putative colanic acid biosynthesis UDP-glucose lipid carrier transferase